MKGLTLVCLIIGFLLAKYLLPEWPWVPIAAATWLTMQLVAGLRELFSA